MNRLKTSLLSTFILVLSLSCAPWKIGSQQNSHENRTTEILSTDRESQVWFEDQTEAVVAHAERLIEKNDREGAVLDERWYTWKRLGPYQDVIFGASQILFYGGLESDVRREVRNRYTALVPVEDDQSAGDIRLFRGERERAPPDIIIIGQNGREVALKTIIRLIYLAKFADNERKQKDPKKFKFFNKSLKVFRSSVGAKEEFIRFFNRYGISHPDVVMIGFRGDIRSLLRREGVTDPESYSDESLRMNWYPNADGKKVLLVSIDENRIFASRSGALIEAILGISGDQPPSITFLGSGGAIDEPEIIGKIVNPTLVLNGDPFPATLSKAVAAHIIRNRALDQTSIRTAHASVESVVVETSQWVAQMKKDSVRTVDQELFHVVNAINSSVNARNVELFVGILVTDNVSSNAAANDDLTLEHAEETISETASVREEFLSKVLTKMGILKDEKTRLPAARRITR